jgi:dienelactone hydrolase
MGMLLLWSSLGLSVPSAPKITDHQAASHLMRYHVALPIGWSGGRPWGVVVVIPDAARDFRGNLEAFVAARGRLPLILVAPEVLTCGGAATRTPEHYSYTPAEWDSLNRQDDFAFDDAGLAAVLADVRRQWGGEPKAFLTGWEAGGHTVWAQALTRPERWRGVAPVSTNYQRRGIGDSRFSSAPERAQLPIQVFRESAAAPSARFTDQQTEQAMADARAHGFAPAAVRMVPGKHGPLAAAVLSWCDSLARR